MSYVIAHGNEDGLFVVDQRTGAVTVAQSLRDVFGRSFRLVVTVKDQGNPERLAVADFTVAVNATSASTASASVLRRGSYKSLDRLICPLSPFAAPAFLVCTKYAAVKLNLFGLNVVECVKCDFI